MVNLALFPNSRDLVLFMDTAHPSSFGNTIKFRRAHLKIIESASAGSSTRVVLTIRTFLHVL